MHRVQIVNICYQQNSKEFYAETLGVQHKSIKENYKWQGFPWYKCLI